MAEMEMVERAARRLDKEMYGGKSFGPAPVPDSPGGEIAREHDRSKLLRWARAAIEAVREPTEKMVERAELVLMDYLGDHGSLEEGNIYDIRSLARQMVSAAVDAALTAPKETTDG